VSKLFRRLMIEKLVAAHATGQLAFYGAHAALVDATAFAAYLAPLKRTRWLVFAKRPFAGPKAVLAYLARYTHRVAILNRRLIAADAKAVAFKVKDYRIEGPGRYKTMTLDPHEFIRRYLIHVLPTGFSPHPPLRSASGWREGRQPRARPQAARRCSTSARAQVCRVRCGYARYAVPVLRLAHAHHRGVQGRSTPAPPADRDASRHQDRYVVSPRSGEFWRVPRVLLLMLAVASLFLPGIAELELVSRCSCWGARERARIHGCGLLARRHGQK
jgi:hypothetical protein